MTQKEIQLPDGLDVETATDVLREFASTDDASIVPQSAVDALDEAKQAFATLLAEQSPQSVEALARQDMDALTEPYRDDDGDIDIDTLRQTPETGEPEPPADPEGSGGDVDFDTLSLGEREDLQRQVRKRDAMLNRDMDKRAGEIEADIVDTLGAESFEDVEPELEAL